MGIWLESERFASITPERREKLEIVLSAYKSVLSPIAYASMPITTGRRFYDVLTRFGVHTAEELRAISPSALYDEIIAPNIDVGIAFAKEIIPRTAFPVVAPSIFEAKRDRWTQDEYMWLWFNVLDLKAREVHMSDGWGYTNGGAEEFTRAMEIQFHWCERDPDISVYDHNGDALTIARGAELLAQAILDLTARGFATKQLRAMLRKLHDTIGILAAHDTPRGQYHYHAPPGFEISWCSGVVRAVASIGG